MVKFTAPLVGYSLPLVRKQSIKRDYFTCDRENDHAGCQPQDIDGMRIGGMSHRYCHAVMIAPNGGAAQLGCHLVGDQVLQAVRESRWELHKGNTAVAHKLWLISVIKLPVIVTVFSSKG